MFYHRVESAKTWTPIPAADMAEDTFGETVRALLRTFEFQDCDSGGYQVSIEFLDAVTGTRTYAVGDYCGWHRNDDDEWVGGNLGDYVYGTYEDAKREGYRPHVYPYGPDRDWLVVA